MRAIVRRVHDQTTLARAAGPLAIPALGFSSPSGARSRRERLLDQLLPWRRG
ncbi:MAG TPA: hypothetical protein VFJ22_17310 [Dermatophilaceae bacterium]|jgi:hypothetical protein|nr:hypothetical protein [Dermatophilaceae bacterium]